MLINYLWTFHCWSRKTPTTMPITSGSPSDWMSKILVTKNITLRNWPSTLYPVIKARRIDRTSCPDPKILSASQLNITLLFIIKDYLGSNSGRQEDYNQSQNQRKVNLNIGRCAWIFPTSIYVPSAWMISFGVKLCKGNNHNFQVHGLGMNIYTADWRVRALQYITNLISSCIILKKVNFLFFCTREVTTWMGPSVRQEWTASLRRTITNDVS